MLISPYVKVVLEYGSLPSFMISLVILLSGLPIILRRVHFSLVQLLDQPLPFSFHPFTALIMISPNESESPTIAGTKQSPTNSLIVNVSLFSPIIADPATNWNVKSGENMAYTHSFIALTINIAARASTSIPNTANIITLTIDVCTISRTAFAISTPDFNVVISLNLKIEYPYITNGPYIHPAFSINALGVIQSIGHFERDTLDFFSWAPT